ncbi:hypothetical protein Y032_0049g1781 [Ancylostoma ceylanicum]|uniref:Tudor domain-containing protein n=1 Tax=Ancylostoma ceylanicum TaxID=53326 RepID=A0A016UA34_9BILA|nr:hypothetical protein Y032_0049g1781 [Ancylostoma ceylanicum]
MPKSSKIVAVPQKATGGGWGNDKGCRKNEYENNSGPWPTKPSISPRSVNWCRRKVLSTRFERVNVNCGQTKRSHSYNSSDPNDNGSQVDKEFEDGLSLNEVSEDEFDVVQPISEKELGEEWSTVIRTISATLPSPQYFKKGDKFLAKVLSAVSPLEFYVIKVAHISVLREIERILSFCDEKLCRHPLLDSQCRPEHACLVRFEDSLARATIGHSGAHEMQVYLVDYGRSLFIGRSQCFAMPKCIAQYAPPLAHYCTLSGAFIISSCQ